MTRDEGVAHKIEVVGKERRSRAVFRHCLPCNGE